MDTIHPPDAGVADTLRRRSTPPLDSPPSSEPEFPGCKPVCLPREALDLYDGRLEFWDGASETAWVCEPTRPYHEAPSRTLMRLATLVAGVRGSPIKGYGSMDLLLRDARGEAWRIRQADESVYLHPARARLPGARAMVLGEDDVPDVVLEVDHSTNVCRGKLRIYEAWGFPEVWVDVPHKRTASQEGAAAGADEPPARRRGLPGFGRSRAFAGWQAEEIHAALNETVPSAWTCAVLERVGMAFSGLGRGRDRTGPDDDPLLRSLRDRSRRAGRALGRLEGLAEGLERDQGEGRAEALAKIARRMLLSRGGDVSEGLTADPAFAASSGDAVLEAALSCGRSGIPRRAPCRPVTGSLATGGLSASTSINALFAAAFLPGPMMAGSNILCIIVRTRLNPGLAPLQTGVRARPGPAAGMSIAGAWGVDGSDRIAWLNQRVRSADRRAEAPPPSPKLSPASRPGPTHRLVRWVRRACR